MGSDCSLQTSRLICRALQNEVGCENNILTLVLCHHLPNLILSAAGPSAQGGEGLELSTALSETTSAWGSHEPQLTVASQLQKDAFLVFRALCKLSIRSDTAPGSELTTIRGKVGKMLAYPI